MTISNRLPALAAEIRAAEADIRKGALVVAERMLAAGRALAEAKQAVPHGGWDTWLAENTGLSARTARRYMQIARSGMNSATVADLGIRGAAEAVAKVRRQSATLYRHGPKILLLDPPQPNPDPLAHGQYIPFVLLDLETGEQVYSRRGIREDWLAPTVRRYGLEFPDAGTWETLSAKQRRELLHVLDLPAPESAEDVSARHTARYFMVSPAPGASRIPDHVIDEAIDAALAVLRWLGADPTPQDVAAFLCDQHLEEEMTRLIAICDRRIADLGGAA